MTDQRNDGLHPRHPGRGKPTSLIRLEGDTLEEGGVMLFLPSGATKVMQWQTPRQITPTLEAAKKYTAQVIDDIAQQHGFECDDIQRTNWVSVIAAVQRCILDFNDRLTKAINTKISRDIITGRAVH